jgi:hypothetical protein
MKRWTRRVLGVLQVGGGFAGLLAIANELGGDAPRGGLGLALFAALLVFGMAAGVALLEGTRWGRRSSIVFWWLQLPVFSSPTIAYALWSGAMLSIGVNFSEVQIGIKADWGAGIEFLLLRDRPYVLAVNLFAVLALYALSRFVGDPERDTDTAPPSLPEHS